jgi:cell division septum initiation protein DivIVA
MDNEKLINENEILKQENTKLKEQLQKYTHSQKEYYEKNKEIVIQKASVNIKKIKETNPEKIKEYAKRAYLKRKEKLQKMKESKLGNENI